MERNNNDRREHFIGLTQHGIDLIQLVKFAIMKVNEEFSEDFKLSSYLKINHLEMFSRSIK